MANSWKRILRVKSPADSAVAHWVQISVVTCENTRFLVKFDWTFFTFNHVRDGRKSRSPIGWFATHWNKQCSKTVRLRVKRKVEFQLYLKKTYQNGLIFVFIIWKDFGYISSILQNNWYVFPSRNIIKYYTYKNKVRFAQSL